MTVKELKKLFKKHNDDEFVEEERIVGMQTTRTDLHAFLLLDRLVPSKNRSDMVMLAEHDRIWLNVSLKDLAKSGITEDQVIELLRCGVFMDEDVDSLSMYV